MQQQHAPRHRLGVLRPYVCVCVCFQLISNCVQLQRACSLHAMEKGYGTYVSTHEDMRASARTMEAPGSASVGDGMAAAAVDWGSGEGGWSMFGVGQSRAGTDDRWMR